MPDNTKDLPGIDPDEEDANAVVIVFNSDDQFLIKCPPGVFVRVRDYNIDDRANYEGSLHVDPSGYEFVYRSV